MSWVAIRVEPELSRLRVVRMVVTSLARRQLLDERLIEDLRLATTEATARAIEAHRDRGIDEPVTVELHINERQVVLKVADRQPVDPSGFPDGDCDPLVPDRLAIVAGIADEYDLRLDMAETVITLRWARIEPGRRSAARP